MNQSEVIDSHRFSQMFKHNIRVAVFLAPIILKLVKLVRMQVSLDHADGFKSRTQRHGHVDEAFRPNQVNKDLAMLILNSIAPISPHSHWI